MLAGFACALTLRRLLFHPPFLIPVNHHQPDTGIDSRPHQHQSNRPIFFTFTELLQESPTSCVDTHVGLWVKCTLTSLVNVEKELKFSLSLLYE